MNVCPGEDSVRCVPNRGSESARSGPITNERTVTKNPSRLNLPCGAGLAGNQEKPGTHAARNVPNAAGKQPACRRKAAIGRNCRSARSKLIFLCSQNRCSWPRKPRRDLANLGRGYHRPGGAGFAKKRRCKSISRRFRTGDFSCLEQAEFGTNGAT